MYSANVQVKDLYSYEKTKGTHATDKNLKKPNFREAMEQIESAAKGDDSAPLDYEVRMVVRVIGIVLYDQHFLFRRFRPMHRHSNQLSMKVYRIPLMSQPMLLMKQPKSKIQL